MLEMGEIGALSAAEAGTEKEIKEQVGRMNI